MATMWNDEPVRRHDDDRNPEGHLTGRLKGKRVVDVHGGRVGVVAAVVQVEHEDRPRWLVVSGGIPFTGHYYVPCVQATMSFAGDVIAGFGRQAIRAAPKAHGAPKLTPELEAMLNTYYRVA